MTILRWKVTVERIKLDRDCGDPDCMCSNHRTSDKWTFYPESAIIRENFHQYELHDGGDLQTVLPEPDHKAG